MKRHATKKNPFVFVVWLAVGFFFSFFLVGVWAFLVGLVFCGFFGKVYNKVCC